MSKHIAMGFAVMNLVKSLSKFFDIFKSKSEYIEDYRCDCKSYCEKCFRATLMTIDKNRNIKIYTDYEDILRVFPRYIKDKVDGQ
jgi:hypothetical protein